MRCFVLLVILLFCPLASYGAEAADVLFFAPFEDSTNAEISGGAGRATGRSQPGFGPGVRGRAVVLGPDDFLSYAFRDNCLTDEGTVMMWVKPEWPSDDDRHHYLFRANTGNAGGKGLNAVMLYKYLSLDKLMFYTSDGRKTSPQEGRSFASFEPLKWEPGEWVHLAATWSSTLAGTEMFLYINGERRGATSGTVYVPDSAPESFHLGARGSGQPTWLDDVLVFSRPLLAGEIAEIHGAYGQQTSARPVELPFVSSRRLQLRPYADFDRDEVAVEVDYRAARRELADGPGRVEVVATEDGRRVTGDAAAGDIGVARVGLDYDALGPGPCELTATLRDAGANTLRTGQLDFDVPRRPVWFGNDLGKGEEVLPPWTPVRVEGDTVEVWGRTYAFDRSPLPRQVTSQGRELLRAPIELTVTAGGTTAKLEAPLENTIDGSDAVAAGTWRGTLGPLACEANGRFEFDGFTWFELELAAAEPVALEAMTLTVPFAPSAATLFHHANGTWTELSDAGGIGPAGWSKELPFVPYVWLGTEKGGLAWFSETDAGWPEPGGDRAVEIVRTDDGVALRIRFVDRKTTLRGPLRLAFGFMATPVKPMPEGWRNWRQLFISSLRLESFAKARLGAPGCRNIGVLWNNHVGTFSYLPANPAEMRDKVALVRAGGWETMLSYFALDFTQTDTPDFRVMEPVWRRNPYRESSFGEGAFGSVCNASSWADFLVWAVDRTMEETGTDGVYFDCSNPDFCRSDRHGCAPGRYPILATRELQKRVYAVVKRRRGEAGFVYSHNSENNILTTFSFADAVLNGEQYNRKDLAGLTWEKFRAELSPQPYGVPAFLLPTLVKFQPEGREKMPGREFLAYPLLHDVICLRTYVAPETRTELLAIQQALRDFDVAEAEFLPYWEDARGVSASPPGTKVSAYLRGDGSAALLIVQGPGDPVTAELTFAGPMAGLRGKPARIVPEPGALKWQGDRLLWPLADRGVRLAVVGLE